MTIANNQVVGSSADGIVCFGVTSSIIRGNKIGTDSTGTIALPNVGDGLWFSGSSFNTIGGTSATEANLISGNLGRGIHVFGDDGFGFNTSENVIQGNLIGTAIDGVSPLGNALEGIYFDGTGRTFLTGNNTIGGTVEGAGNVISANGFNANDGSGQSAGVAVIGTFDFGVTIQGNLIGTDTSGTADLGNGREGVFINATGVVVGGDVPEARNIISGNGLVGVQIANVFGFETSGNHVLGNFIGTDVSGTAALPNGGTGVAINTGAHDNTIGGLTETPGTGAGNVISGNLNEGVGISGSDTFGNVVQGNIVGLNVSGATALPNGVGVAIFFGSHDNTIGGSSDDGARNVVSGNQISGEVGTTNGVGIDIQDSATRNLVAGNFIGTDLTGSFAIGNQNDGVSLFHNPVAVGTVGAFDNTIGGTSAEFRNVISGNGVHLQNFGTDNNLVQGNYTGVDASGNAAIGNISEGVQVSSAATGNQIGGTVAGAGNVISANGFGIAESRYGVLITATEGNLVAGNLIGVGADGATDLGNAVGVGIFFASGNTVGGTTEAARNVIAANGEDGVHISGEIVDGPTTRDNLVLGNYIGLAPNGVTALPNGAAGVEILTSSGNTIGGAIGAARNVISGNNSNGVGITGDLADVPNTNSNLVQGNYIGIAPDGLAALPNTGAGVVVFRSPGNTIGGPTGVARNVISGNTQTDTVVLEAIDTVIEANYSGVDRTGGTA